MKTTHAVPVLILAAGVLAACSQTPPVADLPRPVELVAAGASGSLGRQVFSGEVRARHEADLGFRVPGKLMRRLVDAGAVVRKGQVLAELDPADLRLSADAARAQVSAAETEFGFASAELRRYRALLEQRFISQAAFDAKESAYQASAARLEQARSQHAVTRNQAGYAALLADADGVITAIAAEPGQVLAAGQPAMRLARLGDKEVHVNVPENRLAEFRATKEIGVAVWSRPDKVYRGAIREIAPAADPATRTYTAKITIVDADAEVLWGMTANALLLQASAATGAVVPLSAVAQRGQEAIVWVADPQTSIVQPRSVRLGQYREDGATVLDGLRPGELVVAAGVHKLVAGQKVRLPQGAQAGAGEASKGLRAS